MPSRMYGYKARSQGDATEPEETGGTSTGSSDGVSSAVPFTGRRARKKRDERGRRGRRKKEGSQSRWRYVIAVVGGVEIVWC